MPRASTRCCRARNALGYHEVPSNQLPLKRHVERLQWAEGIVFCFPTWCFGLPAMLKGYFDRLFMPGVAFDLSDPKNVKPMLTNIQRIEQVHSLFEVPSDYTAPPVNNLGQLKLKAKSK